MNFLHKSQTRCSINCKKGLTHFLLHPWQKKKIHHITSRTFIAFSQLCQQPIHTLSFINSFRSVLFHPRTTSRIFLNDKSLYLSFISYFLSHNSLYYLSAKPFDINTIWISISLTSKCFLKIMNHFDFSRSFASLS